MLYELVKNTKAVVITLGLERKYDLYCKHKPWKIVLWAFLYVRITVGNKCLLQIFNQVLLYQFSDRVH